MDKRMLRSIMFIILFTGALVLFVVKFDVVAAFLASILSTLTPVFIGFAIAFVLHRPFNFFRRQLEKTRLRRAATPLAVVLSYLALLAVIFAIISFIVPQIAASFQQFAGNFSTYFSQAQAWLNSVIARFDLQLLKNVNVPSLGSLLQDMITQAAGMLSELSVHVFSFTTSLISGVITALLGLIFSVYMLAGSDRLLAQCRRVVIAYVPRRVADPLLEITRLSADTFSSFISGQLTEACILGGLCFLGMCLFRFEYAPLISVLVGVLSLIPIVGAYLGAITSALLLLMVSPMMALWFLVFLIILQQFEGNVIYPKVVGRHTGLPGIWVLAAVTIGGGLGGLVGLLLAVPVTSVLYVLIQRSVRARLRAEPSQENEAP